MYGTKIGILIKTIFKSGLNHILNCVNECDFGTKCFVKAEHFVLRLIHPHKSDRQGAIIK